MPAGFLLSGLKLKSRRVCETVRGTSRPTGEGTRRLLQGERAFARSDDAEASACGRRRSKSPARHPLREDVSADNPQPDFAAGGEAGGIGGFHHHDLGAGPVDFNPLPTLRPV